jgi:hypothetical protein
VTIAAVATLCTALVPPLSAEENGKKKVVLIAGRQSHGYGSHDHYAGCMLLAKALQATLPNFKCVVVRDGYPKDTSVFKDADAVVIFSDGGGGHPYMPHLKEIDELFDKGVGLAFLHYAVEIPKGDPGNYFLKWMGGYFETDWSVNPFFVAKFKEFPTHPITRGIKPFQINDEWYYHMRFRENLQGVTPILSDLPPADTLKRADGPHSNNPAVRAAVLERKELQHLAWASEAPGGQRGFGFTGGHFQWNWGEPNFRRLVLNAIVWVAKGEVPENGVGDQPLTLKMLEENIDEPQPAKFDRQAIRKQFNIDGETGSGT